MLVLRPFRAQQAKETGTAAIRLLLFSRHDINRVALQRVVNLHDSSSSHSGQRRPWTARSSCMQPQQSGPGAGPVVLVSACKGEVRSLRSGYKALARHLKAARCDVRRLEGLTAGALEGATIVLFGGPSQPFTVAELDCLRAYLRGGGSLLVLGTANGEGAGGPGSSSSGSMSGAGPAPAGHDTNINCLLEECGMSLAKDCVIQTAFTRRVCLPANAAAVLLRLHSTRALGACPATG